MEQERVERNRDETAQVKPYAIHDAAELSPEGVAEAMRTGTFEVVVDGALSEWGSRLEALINKLERSVMEWHEEGVSKTVVIRFVEPEPATEAEGGDAEGTDEPSAS